MGIVRVIFVPVRCPRCGKRGEPAKVPPCRPGEWEAELRCPGCGQKWIAKMKGYPVRNRGRGR